MKTYRIEQPVMMWNSIKTIGVSTRCAKTGEYRPPKKGEYYLSGCKGFEMGYRAPADLGTAYHIMRLVLDYDRPIRNAED